jgi:hypothetical protein
MSLAGCRLRGADLLPLQITVNCEYVLYNRIIPTHGRRLGLTGMQEYSFMRISPFAIADEQYLNWGEKVKRVFR